MSVALMPVLQFVAGAYSAKTAMDGLHEGNIAKAVLGGVGAYFAFSGLAAANTAGAAGELGTEAGQAVADKAAEATVAETASQGVADAAAGTVAETGTGLINAPATAPVATAAGETAATTVAETAAPKGFLANMNQWAQKNPLLAYGGMQVAGQALAGSAEQDWQEKQMAEQQRREDESRERRGYWASPNTGRVKYNPKTGQFEPVAA